MVFYLKLKKISLIKLLTIVIFIFKVYLAKNTKLHLFFRPSYNDEKPENFPNKIIDDLKDAYSFENLNFKINNLFFINDKRENHIIFKYKHKSLENFLINFDNLQILHNYDSKFYLIYFYGNLKLKLNEENTSLLLIKVQFNEDNKKTKIYEYNDHSNLDNLKFKSLNDNFKVNNNNISKIKKDVNKKKIIKEIKSKLTNIVNLYIVKNFRETENLNNFIKDEKFKKEIETYQNIKKKKLTKNN